jgi:hypothetical protein
MKVEMTVIECRVHQLDAVEVKQPAQEVARQDAEPALDVREENDGFAGPLRRELLSCRRPPADLHLGHHSIPQSTSD